MRTLWQATVLAGCYALLPACGSEPPTSSSDDAVGERGDSGVKNQPDAKVPQDGGGGGAPRSDARVTYPVSDAAIGEGNETLCDGIDNDGNGIIDDVDIGHDGVCDCLLTATLGHPATEGPGDVFADWLSMRSSNGAAALTDQVLTADLLKPFQIIVVQNVTSRSYSADEVSALQDWVMNGGGLITLTGYGPLFETVNVNKLLAPSGIQYGGIPVLFGGAAPATLPITDWQPHPVSDMVRAVGFNNGYEVQGTGDEIAQRDGTIVLRVATLGQGKVLAWGDEWITINTEWKDHPEYDTERFWLNMFKWLSPPKECQVPITQLL